MSFKKIKKGKKAKKKRQSEVEGEMFYLDFGSYQKEVGERLAAWYETLTDDVDRDLAFCDRLFSLAVEVGVVLEMASQGDDEGARKRLHDSVKACIRHGRDHRKSWLASQEKGSGIEPPT